MRAFAVDRHLSQCADASGMFVILAIDHRANLVEDMQLARGSRPQPGEVVAFKQAAIRELSGIGSALLTDPDFGFPALVASGVRSDFGLLAPLEVTDYSVHPSRRQTVFIENWGVERIKRAGCSGVKLLLYYHPNADNAASQTELVDRVIDECRRHAVPLFLEPITYALDVDKPLDGDERARAVVETARHFSTRGVDVLKVQFPLDPAAEEGSWDAALAELDDASSVPWALLSAGVSFDLFLRQTAAACRAGASGVIVGRAVWTEGLALEGAELHHFMRTTARARLRALASICDLYGTPWHARTGRPELDENWYRTSSFSPST